jgi:hypothetical protein
MESHVHFPPGVEPVGRVPVRESEDFREDLFYVKGIHPELNFLGKVSFIQGDTGPETQIDVIEGPSEYFYG